MLLLSVLLFADPVQAQPTPTAGAVEQAAPSSGVKAVDEKPVCRRDVALGTILPKRICRSRAQRAAIDRANAQAAEDARRRNVSNAPPTG